jgi:hypothetical protein
MITGARLTPESATALLPRLSRAAPLEILAEVGREFERDRRVLALAS